MVYLIAHIYFREIYERLMQKLDTYKEAFTYAMATLTAVLSI